MAGARLLIPSIIILAVLASGAASARDAIDDEEAIFAAVLREVVDEMLDESLLVAGGVACLGIDPGHAPQSVPKEFLEAFGERPVRRGAECEKRPDGAVELATDRPAILITAGPIDRVEEDEAWVTVRYYRTALLSAQRVYRVVEERSGWVCLGQIIQMAPA
jgi:hypothetical protein